MIPSPRTNRSLEVPSWRVSTSSCHNHCLGTSIGRSPRSHTDSRLTGPFARNESLDLLAQHREQVDQDANNNNVESRAVVISERYFPNESFSGRHHRVGPANAPAVGSLWRAEPTPCPFPEGNPDFRDDGRRHIDREPTVYLPSDSAGVCFLAGGSSDGHLDCRRSIGGTDNQRCYCSH